MRTFKLLLKGFDVKPPQLIPAHPSVLTRPPLLPSFEVQGGNPFRLAAAIRVGKHDTRGAAAALLTLRRVRNDDILAGDGLPLPVMGLPDLPRCFACGMACEAVSHAWRDRLPRSPCGSKQNKI